LQPRPESLGNERPASAYRAPREADAVRCQPPSLAYSGLDAVRPERLIFACQPASTGAARSGSNVMEM